MEMGFVVIKSVYVLKFMHSTLHISENNNTVVTAFLDSWDAKIAIQVTEASAWMVPLTIDVCLLFLKVHGQY